MSQEERKVGLSEKEKELMAKLQKKAEEPDAPSGNINFSLDLSSDTAWERAKKLGIVSDDEPPESDPENKPEEVPTRKGYFGT